MNVSSRSLICGLIRGLLPYQVASNSSIQPFGHNRHGLKIGWGWVCSVLFSWVAGSPIPIEHKVSWAKASLHTKWHLSPSVWPQRTLTENWGLCPFRGELHGPHLPASMLALCQRHCVNGQRRRWGSALARHWSNHPMSDNWLANGWQLIRCNSPKCKAKYVKE